MFWSGKVSFFTDLIAFIHQRPLSIVPRKEGLGLVHRKAHATRAVTRDAPGIAKLLNGFFESNAKCKTDVTVEWVVETFIAGAIWVVVKDWGGTIRGCIASIPCPSPYNTSELDGILWGIVDWYCVHPLWRSKGLGSALLETLDQCAYVERRHAHIFIKEGYPLPLPHIPFYVTRLYCRRAGNPAVHLVPKEDWVHPYMTKEKATGLPLIRVSPLVPTVPTVSPLVPTVPTVSPWRPMVNESVHEWEKRLDSLLPPCIVFVSSGPLEDVRWKPDSLVSLYPFRWVAGKWLGSVPNSMIV